MAHLNGSSSSSSSPRPGPALDLLEAHDFAVSIGLQAGSYLRAQSAARCGLVQDATPVDLTANVKVNSVDIVTEADFECERMITEAIRAKYPTHKIIGEESYSAGQEKRFLLDDEPTWIVDPLDGTVNYLHLFPLFCISIALVVRKEPVVGVIYAPFASGVSSHPQDSHNGTLYSAANGYGAYLTPVDPSSFTTLVGMASSHTNAVAAAADSTTTPTCSPTPYSTKLPLLKPVPPLSPEAPKGCLFAAEWGKDRRDKLDGNLTKKVNSMWNMACEIGGRSNKGGMVHGVRSLGSAALDMAYVATGAVDIFWEAGCWEWDIAAGTCILHEAGGFMYSAQPPDGLDLAKDEGNHEVLPTANLGGRLYLAIRPCADTEGETAKEAQDRVAKAVWSRVERMDYRRPMA